MPPPEPDELKRLGDRIDEAAHRRTGAKARKPPTPWGIAGRFGTEMLVAVALGAGIGWGIDWAFDHWGSIHTKPWGMVVFFVLGAVAGIRNVMRAAKEINAEMASKE